MSSFETAIGPLLADEGEGVNPHDNGRGPSKWGVTLMSYRELVPSATEQDIYDLTREQATAFYRRMHWDKFHIGLIDDQPIATKLLNLGANIGQGTAIQFLQRAVGAPADGTIGPKTAAAANRISSEKLLEGIRTTGAQYYRELVARRPEYARFLEGWLKRLKG
jgi:lysozyme family protein